MPLLNMFHFVSTQKQIHVSVIFLPVFQIHVILPTYTWCTFFVYFFLFTVCKTFIWKWLLKSQMDNNNKIFTTITDSSSPLHLTGSMIPSLFWKHWYKHIKQKINENAHHLRFNYLTHNLYMHARTCITVRSNS